MKVLSGVLNKTSFLNIDFGFICFPTKSILTIALWGIEFLPFSTSLPSRCQRYIYIYIICINIRYYYYHYMYIVHTVCGVITRLVYMTLRRKRLLTYARVTDINIIFKPSIRNGTRVFPYIIS